jgi:hypothetical protein
MQGRHCGGIAPTGVADPSGGDGITALGYRVNRALYPCRRSACEPHTDWLLKPYPTTGSSYLGTISVHRL